LSQTSDEKDLGLSVSSGSRNTDLLSKYHRLKLANGNPQPGLDLIVKKKDPSNRCRQTLWLTPKGVQIINKFKSILCNDK